MTELDQQRIDEWIGDAFAILCVRVGSLSKAETKLRLGVEAILRHLGTPPLRIVASTPPPFARVAVTNGDLRMIRKALDSCLAVFERYAGTLTPRHRRIEALVRSARDFADEELGKCDVRDRSHRMPKLVAA